MPPLEIDALTRAERVRRTARVFETIRRLQERSGTQAESRRVASRIEALRAHAVTLNLEVAAALANRYRGRGLADDDLQQVACEGLVKAVRRFDPAIRDDLLGYAVPVIRGEIQRHFRDVGWAVRPPRRVQDLQQSLRDTTSDLAQELDRTPTEQDLAAALGVPIAEVGEALAARACFTPVSLDRPVGEAGVESMGEVLLVLEAADAEIEAVETRLVLEPLVRRLPPRDRRVLQLRFVLERTQEEIGAELGVTQMQVSRILQRILSTLRDALDDSATRAA